MSDSPQKTTAKRSRSTSQGRRRSSRSRSRSTTRKQTPTSNGSATKAANGAAKARSAPSTPTRFSRRIQENAEKQIQMATGKSGGDAAKPKGNKNMATPTAHSDAPGFGGAWGGAALTILLPATVYWLTFACTKENGCSLTRVPTFPTAWQAYFNPQAFGLVLAWYLLHAGLAMIPVGTVVKGQPLKDGRQLEYRCNAWLALIVTVVGFAVAVKQKLPMDWVQQHWLQVVTAGIVYSFLIAVWMYVRSLRAKPSELAPEATGNFFNDFFMGRELNPRCNHLDYKFFFELRPGLIGWMVIDWCLLAAQFQAEGAVQPALALVTLFQTVYVMDALNQEPAILTTLDITTEGFGFMLAFGDLAWVPYLYSLQARFLYAFPQAAVADKRALLAICVIKALGLVIFRGANGQKNEFRKNPYSPALAHLKTIPTSTGKKLLCGGFWGICRRPNYLGDLLMALAWSLPCGTAHLLPYFYPVYFFILLVHRNLRDESYCKQRYGEAWDKYTAAVPYRIIPYVF